MRNVSSDLIGTSDVAEILGISPGRVNQLKDKLNGKLIGTALVFSRAVVEEFKKKKRPVGKPRKTMVKPEKGEGKK
jgi:hypothetical protein